MAQRRHIGFASSHFTRRALQVLHPVRTLDALSRVLFCAKSRLVVIVNDAATRGSLVILKRPRVNTKEEPSHRELLRVESNRGQLCTSIARPAGSTGDARAVGIPEAGLVAMCCTALRNMAACNVFRSITVA